jgi:hypothetical protein
MVVTLGRTSHWIAKAAIIESRSLIYQVVGYVVSQSSVSVVKGPSTVRVFVTDRCKFGDGASRSGSILDSIASCTSQSTCPTRLKKVGAKVASGDRPCPQCRVG